MLHSSEEQLSWLKVTEERAQEVSVGLYVTRGQKYRVFSQTENLRGVTSSPSLAYVQPFFQSSMIRCGQRL